MNGAQDLDGVIDHGLELLEEERRILMVGAYQLLSELAARKEALLIRLNKAIRAAPRSAEILVAIDRLIQCSRRNESLLRAAREGIAFARRRIAAIHAARQGAVAYAEDGSPIACAADGGSRERSV